MTAADLILASASPRRRELLERMGLALVIVPAEVDETPLPGERPDDYVKRIAAAKCDAVADGGAAAAAAPELAVVGADTIVIADRRDPGQAGRRGRRATNAGRSWPDAGTTSRRRTGSAPAARLSSAP